MATPACKPALRTVFSSAQREFYESLAAGGGARASTGAADEGAPPVYCQALADKIGVMISTLSAFCVPTAFPTSEICQA